MLATFMLRTARCCLLLLGVLGLILWLESPVASAKTLHAGLLRSEPAEGSVQQKAPTLLRLWFSERIQNASKPLSVFDPSGRVVPLGVAHISELHSLDSDRSANGLVYQELSVPLHISQAGTYLVSWHVTSQDSDPVSGTFVFSFGYPGGRWTTSETTESSPLGLWLQTLAHWLHFAGYAFGFGTLAFHQFLLRPLRLTPLKQTETRLQRLISTGILLLVLAEPLALLAQTISLSGGPLDTEIAAEALSSSFGRTLALRLGAALLLWILQGMNKEGNERAFSAGLVLAIGLAFVDSTASHAINSGWLGLILNTIHIAAMGIWVGGLISLLLLWNRPILKERQELLLSRFAALALTTLAEILITGSLLLWLRISQPLQLLNTTYGHVLSVKLVFVGLALGLVFVSLHRRLEQRQRWWRSELLALLLVLLLVGLLVSLPPPR